MLTFVPTNVWPKQMFDDTIQATNKISGLILPFARHHPFRAIQRYVSISWMMTQIRLPNSRSHTPHDEKAGATAYAPHWYPAVLSHMDWGRIVGTFSRAWLAMRCLLGDRTGFTISVPPSAHTHTHSVKILFSRCDDQNYYPPRKNQKNYHLNIGVPG